MSKYISWLVEYFIVQNNFVSFSNIGIQITLSILVLKLFKEITRTLDINFIRIKYRNYFILGIWTIVFISSYVYVFLLHIKAENNTNLLGIYFLVIILIIFLLSIYYYIKYTKKYIESIANHIELKNIYECSKISEEMYEHVQKFKHDYKNILLTINHFLEENNYEELKKFFYEDVIKTNSIIETNDFNFQLKNIEVLPLKALITSKLIKANNLGIKITVDFSIPIKEIFLDMIDCIRIFGCLLDNSIEAATESNEKKMYLGGIIKNNSLVFCIENSFIDKGIPINKYFEKGFSTKGDNRGYGLFNVREILKKYNNCFLSIEKKEHIFKNEIWISFCQSKGSLNKSA